MAKFDMTGLGEIAIGILVLIIIYGIVPIVGEQMDNAINIPGYVNNSNHAEGVRPGGNWNTSINSDVPTGVSLWVQLSPFIGLSAIIIMIAGFLRVLKGMREGGEGTV